MFRLVFGADVRLTVSSNSDSVLATSLLSTVKGMLVSAETVPVWGRKGQRYSYLKRFVVVGLLVRDID